MKILGVYVFWIKRKEVCIYNEVIYVFVLKYYFEEYF